MEECESIEGEKFEVGLLVVAAHVQSSCEVIVCRTDMHSCFQFVAKHVCSCPPEDVEAGCCRGRKKDPVGGLQQLSPSFVCTNAVT